MVIFSDTTKQVIMWKLTVPWEEHMEEAHERKLVKYQELISHTPLPPAEPPESTVYSRDDLRAGTPNTLICFVNHFYPPSIQVSWTKNNLNVTEGVTLSRIYPNADGTFYLFSTLSFIPEEGDIYSCTVEHKSLDEPRTTIWESDVELPHAGPSVFCGVGLTIGILGLAAGTFLLIAGNNCR
ncbi:rano class II histocompatibility antigen, B alpha chain-like [Chanos chanos]|uniref:Rano class II histocompatibility antigen, B alpha chain-like n=1 Tax=Chanos chanos TaxID=29144 RepID=A0A6J2UND8_CHACN|nr:rano class II histocompatibility antigen, B alpha chain-like [Chanos chanos]